MNILFYIIAIIIYTLNYLLIEIFDINAHNTLWSAIFFIVINTLLNIGCIINSVIFKKKYSALRFLFYYLTFMCSLGILLVAILTSFLLKSITECIIILIIYIVLSLVSILGTFICKKIKSKNKDYFLYFSILFILSCVIHTILILTIVI